ncbi:hypothetical protein AAEX28_12905 [Lentisphaerota bacterium WC36G]|nr:hypothetical protein LJT99_15725 [Lentisphaerae bacterium WC36]
MHTKTNEKGEIVSTTYFLVREISLVADKKVKDRISTNDYINPKSNRLEWNGENLILPPNKRKN